MKGDSAWDIEVRGLVKTFGFRRVLRGLDLQVRRGEFLTIFGPNGAGKTTLIRVLATLSSPTSGVVKVAGLDLKEEAAEIRRHLGVVSHQPFLYEDLTAEENLRFYGRMYGIASLEQRVGEALEEVRLGDRARDRVRTLSHGMRKRLSIARALLHLPAILLLDEPETGLDQEALALLWRLLEESRRTVIMTTHNLERGLERGDRVAILAQGRILYQEARSALDRQGFQRTYQELTRARG